MDISENEKKGAYYFKNNKLLFQCPRDLTEIFNWLKVNVHEQGNLYTPAQLVERVTGEPLNPQYFLDYLNEKYSKIYHF